MLEIRTFFAFTPVLWFSGQPCRMWKRWFDCQSAVHEKAARVLFLLSCFFFSSFSSSFNNNNKKIKLNTYEQCYLDICFY